MSASACQLILRSMHCLLCVVSSASTDCVCGPPHNVLHSISNLCEFALKCSVGKEYLNFIQTVSEISGNFSMPLCTSCKTRCHLSLQSYNGIVSGPLNVRCLQMVTRQTNKPCWVQSLQRAVIVSVYCVTSS